MGPQRIYRSFIRVSVPLVIVAMAACQCDNDGLGGADPQPQIDQEVLDFGWVEVGTSHDLDLVVANTGQGQLDVSSVTVEPVTDPAKAFWFHPRPSSFRVTQGSTGRVTISFLPLDEAEVEARLVLHTNAREQPVREVLLRGHGYVPTIVVDPFSLDFGNVVIDSSKTETVVVQNTSEEPTTVRIGALQGQSASHYRLTLPSNASGETIYLPTGEQAQIQVNFAPSLTGRHLASFAIDSCEACPTMQVNITGIGVNSALVVEPSSIDFGAVNPHSTRTADVTFRNQGNMQVRVTALAMQGVASGQPSDPAFGLDPPELPILLAPGESSVVTVTFTPPALENHYSALAWQSTDNRNPDGRVLLVGRGGGPTIDVIPRNLSFGPVALTTPMRRSVVVSNVGYDALRIHELEIRGSGAFQIVSELGDPLLQVGDYRRIEIQFSPEAEQGYAGSLVIHNDDLDDPKAEVSLTGEGLELAPCDYEVRPEELRFGILDRNRARTLTIGITASGDNEDACLVSLLELEPDTDAAFRLPGGEVAGHLIAPGDTWYVPVEFRPTEPGEFSGAARFYASSPAQPEYSVPLSGSSHPTDVMLAPDELDFGVVEIGCASREREICIYNTGSSNIHVTDLQIAHAGPDSEFTFGAIPPDISTPQGQRIQPGGRACFTVTYRPVDFGEDTAALYVTLAEYPEPFLVVLMGRGDTSAYQTDEFVQLERPMADILFVIDDSCSMGPYQTALAQNLASFMEFAIQQDIDYHIGVITTDARDSHGGGILRPLDGSRPRIITPRLSDPLGVFRQNVAVGTSGDGIERGFWSAEKALTEPIMNDPNKNGGFIREDASFALIFISDEPEQSANSVDYYLNIFMGVKGFRRPEMFTTSSIVSTASGCAHSGPHHRYMDVAQRTGGVISSICSADWAADLRDLSTVAFGFKSRFPLTSTPVPNSVEVVITSPDGEAIHPTQWEYSAETNSIEFHPLAIPQPGDKISVTYEVACLP